MSTPQSSQLTLLTIFDALFSFLWNRCSPDGSSQARDLSAGHDQKCELTVHLQYSTVTYNAPKEPFAIKMKFFSIV